MVTFFNYNSTYLIDQLATVGLVTARARTTAFLQRGYGQPGVVNPRPGASGALVPPNVSVQNQTNQWGPFVSSYGAFQWFPPYGGIPYVEYTGQHTYARALYILGYGPLEISEYWLGNVKLNLVWSGNLGYDEINDVEVEVVFGNPGDPAMTLYPSEAIQDANEVTLSEEWSYRQVAKAADEVICLFNFPNGLNQTDPSTGLLSGAGVDLIINWAQSDGAGNVIGSWSADIVLNEFAATPYALQRTQQIDFPSRDFYIVRARRTTAQSSDSNFSDECDWQAMTTLVNDDPVPPLIDSDRSVIPLAKIAIRAQTTDSKQQTLDNFSIVSQRHLPVWNGSAWVTQATSSPAWAAVDYFSGQMNKRKIPLSRWDTAALADWDSSCSTLGLQFNFVLDQAQQAGQAARDIATAGRATFSQINGLYSIIHDETKSGPEQFFTYRNSSNCKFTKMFPRNPDFLIMQWTNPDVLYQQDEIYVYADGFNADGSDGMTEGAYYETMQLVGVTSAAQAHKLGRYFLACGILRTRVITLDVDIEHLLSNIGDRVGINHDLLLIGSGSAYITAVQKDGSGNVTGVTIDDQFGMVAETIYSLRVRMQDASTILEPVVNNEGLQSTFVFQTPIPHTDTILPQPGDLVMFGVDPTSDFIITKIEPSSKPHMSATITCVDYSPNIFNSDTENIGTFVSQITLPFAEQNRPVPAPKIVALQSGGNVMSRNPDGTLSAQIVATLSAQDSRVTNFEARYVVTGSGAQWTYAPVVSSQSGQFIITGVQAGIAYDLEFRSITALSLASDFDDCSQPGYVVQGNSNSIPDVSGLNINNTLLTWNAVAYPDLAGYQVKQIAGSTANWSQGTFVATGFVTVNQLDISTLPSGTVTIMVKAMDSAGQLSTDPDSLTLNVGDPLVSNVVLATDYKAAGFPGTITGASIDGSGNLSATSATPFWTNPSAPEWTNPSSPFWTAQYNPLSYILDYTVTGAELPGNLIILANLLGSGATIQWRVNTTSATSPFWGSGSSTFWQTPGSTPFWTPGTWSAWQPWNGSMPAVAGTYEFWIQIPAGPTQGSITGLVVELDVPDVDERLQNVSILAGGTRLPIAKTYKAIEVVNITFLAGTTGGLTCRVQDKATTIGAGPLIEIFDQTGTSVAGTVDAVIEGY